MACLFPVARAQQVPVDVGTTVNGYQDDFDGSGLSAGWTALGAQGIYTVNNGMLHVATAAGDPNHLIYQVSGYNNSVQEVLVRIRVTNFGTGDSARGGIAIGVDPAASPAGGIDFLFRDVAGEGQTGRHLSFLDDLRAWIPTGLNFAWQNNTWYWLRLRQDPNAAAQGGVNDVFGKIWLADGSVAEPASWQLIWDYTPSRSTRTGYAAITAGSSGGTSEFDVDYILIKASGLPAITVAPGAFVQIPAAITNQPASQVVVEGSAVTFTVGAAGNPRPTYQWYRNDAPIADATNASFTVSPVPLLYSNSTFKAVAQNVISNTTYTTTSSNAVLTVQPDLGRPRVDAVQSLGLSQVLVTFSERVTAATATNKSNFAITNLSGPVSLQTAVLDASGSNVVLTVVGSLVNGGFYALIVSNITDTSVAANMIAPGSITNFVATSYTSVDIGNPAPAGSGTSVTGGYNVTGGGSNIGGTNDSFQFDWQLFPGDFDIKVRVESLGLSDAWAKAGLMAREDITAGGRFAAVFATPTISGCYFQKRDVTNGLAAATGSFPANYPNTWLRLKRVGTQFTGYAGYDGQGWVTVGSAALPQAGSMYLGFAVSSHNTNTATTAAFRDIATVTTETPGSLRLATEPLGQASRFTSLVISEIMYHPASTRGTLNTNAQGYITNSLEFIELFNSAATPEDIGGYRLSGDIDYTFPPGTVVAGGGFVVIARSPADIQAVYGLSGVLGPYTNSLSNSSGTVRLRNRIGAVYLEVNYDSQPPWPAAADGAGHSLVLARPSVGQDNFAGWAASDAIGGSPGRLEAITSDPLRNVVINEFLAHTEAPDADFVELYNRSSQPLDLTGCVLSDDPDTNKFVIPPGTILGPRSFVAWNESQLGFALSASGETIFLRSPNGRVLDAIRFEAQANGVSFGRSPDGAATLRPLAGRTPGTNNTAFWAGDVVINEIMYNPISHNDDDQYVELYNRGTNPVSLAGWRFTAGISFTFPSNTVLNPDSYIVVARSAARMTSNYANLTPANLVGDFGGKLSHNGERLALARPDPLVGTNSHGVLTTNTIHVVVNEVTYGAGGRWGTWSDGGGSSLELRDPRSDNSLAANWSDSDETGKAEWTPFSFTGMVDNGDVAADQLQILLLGSGECLVDDVEVLNSAGANQVANSSFESGAAGWTAEGTEKTSGVDTSGGYNSPNCYHVRAIERGDNQVNRVRTPLTAALAANTTATIRAKVRWLKGHPEVLLRIRGKWLELFCSMNLPLNLGTPAARNSRAVTNAPPAISEVMHAPVLPAGGEPCVVTARVSDPDKPVTLTLKYRVDPGATYSSVTMADNGAGGDAVAGDGIYSATIPGQAAGTMVAFYLQAADQPGATATFPNDAPVRECLVRFGEIQPAGSFPTYRIWMTQATLSTWNGRSKLDNTPLDVTFVLGNRRSIYNATALYAGSPYIAPGYSGATSGRCGYTVTFPSDDLFLGTTDLVLDWPGGHGGENTAMQEQMGYYIADKLNLPFSHRYTIRLHVNGVTDDQRQAAFEAVNQPGGDFVKAWSPDATAGNFYKIDRGFEFSDAGALVADPMPRLDNWTTTGGVKKTSRYRWNWYTRAGDTFSDYTNVFSLVDAANAAAPEPYTSQMQGLADIDEWMGILGVEHIIVNFDSWGHEIGKNMYGYKPDDGKWQLYMFDLDWLMLAAPLHNGSYAASTASLFTCEDPNLTRMFNHPPFRRAYFRVMQDAVNGPLNPANCNPVMDAKYASLVANGIQYCDGQALVAPTAVQTWFSQRRTYLTTQLAAIASPFTIATNLITTNNNLVTISGTAPVMVKTIFINGVDWPVTWNSISNWTLRLPVSAASNDLAIVGYDPRGAQVAGASNHMTVAFTGSSAAPQGNVVFNEIMFDPAVPDAEYLELFNSSFTTSFDLTGWRINGLSYTFPNGSYIGPRSYLVLAKNRGAFAAAYGATIIVFDGFDGNLQRDGETLTLIKPGVTPDQDAVVDQVRYEGAAPWPAAGPGSSVQLADSTADNSRVGAWRSSYVPARTNDGWRFASVTATFGSNNRLLLYLDFAGSLILDDIALVSGTNAEVGSNYIQNGGFESALDSAVWVLGTNMTASTIVDGPVHSGQGALRLVQTSAGSASSTARDLQQFITPAPTNLQVCTLSFWYFATNAGATNFLGRVVSSALNFTNNITVLVTPATNVVTPGTNNFGAAPMPEFPPLWINELQAENLTGLRDSYGERDPWLEVYNAGTNAVSLDGLYLSLGYSNLAAWPFPAGSILAAREFKVIWCDGQPLQTSNSEWHTSFRLPAGQGSVALSRLVPAGPQVMDYINYSALHADRSFGSFPDGQPFDRQEFIFVTPGRANDGRSAPLAAFINEWMASNTNFISDPADGKFQDWFEVFNPGAGMIDLAGYYFTDTISNKFKYRVTTAGTHTIGPGGHLLVWADNDTTQNSSNRIDLHVGFKLSKSGGDIGLFAADGTTIDYVRYSAQTGDVSQGRYPDGGASLVSFPGSASPRAANYVNEVNTPPVLAPMGATNVYAGQALHWVATATDADVPAQLLTFSLDPGAPAGASITGGGSFNWTPSIAGDYSVTVRVTDSGTPPMSATQVVPITVFATPRFTSAVRNGASFELTWSSRPQQGYRIEYKDDLAAPAWTFLQDITATGDSVVLTTSATASNQRFYRVTVLP